MSIFTFERSSSGLGEHRVTLVEDGITASCYISSLDGLETTREQLKKRIAEIAAESYTSTTQET